MRHPLGRAKKMRQQMIKIFLILSFLFDCALAQSEYGLFQTDKHSDRVVLQPKGNYAVIFFYEDALANYCSVIYYNPMRDPRDGAWSISQRIWQDPIWSDDVSSIAWSPNGEYLYVATSQVYGEGGLFRLTLKEKTYKRLLPKADESIPDTFLTYIEQIDKKTGIMYVTISTAENKYHKTYSIEMDSAP
jgi:hypothetical protein